MPSTGLGGKPRISRQRKRILQLHAKGHSDAEIAQKMGVRVETVHYYWKYIFRALGVQGQPKPRVLALEKAAAKGIITRRTKLAKAR